MRSSRRSSACALAEAARVLRRGGTALYVTPNRLTFGRPDEVIDPYHHVEWDAAQLHALLASTFAHVEVRGLFGSPRYLALLGRERRTMERVLALDRLRLRRAVPRRARQRLYDAALRHTRRAGDPGAAAIEPGDFHVADAPLDAALDLVAICRTGGRG